MKYTITSEGGRIQRGEDIELLASRFSPKPSGPDGGMVTVFQGDTDNVLYYGPPQRAADYVLGHPEHLL